MYIFITIYHQKGDLLCVKLFVFRFVQSVSQWLVRSKSAFDVGYITFSVEKECRINEAEYKICFSIYVQYVNEFWIFSTPDSTSLSEFYKILYFKSIFLHIVT